ncbi:MAG: hypothetical protein HLUCCA08_00690 [Rhodobacteraceae bacterium HLUCCA08]|nr:MAG: hypothetical protein HLUCCA08_00690 [Rhodobacteraceae bacterium HLUCCA08]
MPQDRFAFRTSKAQMLEAMVLAGQTLGTRAMRFREAVLGTASLALAAIGGLGVMTLLAPRIGLPPAVALPFGALAGGAIWFAGITLPLHRLARGIVGTPRLAGPEEISLTETGLVYRSGATQWVTAWTHIDDVVEGREVVVLTSGGVGFGLPRTAIGDAAAVKALVAEARARIGRG